MDEDEFNPLEELIAVMGHTHHCTMPYCQEDERRFAVHEPVSDVVQGLTSFGTMHPNCARLFRLQWHCRARAYLN